MLLHLSAFSGHVFPFAHIIAPLVIWLLKKDTSAFMETHGKEAVNAQITFTVYVAIAIPLCFLIIGIPLFALVYIGNVVLVIMAAIAAREGRAYRYPYIIRFLK